MESEPARHWTVIAAIVVFASAAVANAVATRARHFGWIMLAGVVALAAAGY